MKNYYILKSGRLRRKQNTLYLETKEEKRAIPINDIEALYIFGEVDINTKLLIFLSQNKIPVHFFNYYDLYIGSFYPREYLNSGIIIVNQVKYYLDNEKRIEIAKEIVDAAIYNITKNLKYYSKHEKEVDELIQKIENEKAKINAAKDIKELMGIEGKSRQYYYQSFDKILRKGFEFEKRTRGPPENMINCLISFGNSLLYTVCLTEIYHTQLNPTISYLHEPFERRFSLALDIAEIFKPIIVDRVIFNLINNRLIKDEHFDKQLNFCYLNDKGKRIFIEHFDEKLKTTIKHKDLKRSISYQHLIRIECYKLINHLIGDKKFSAFRIWW
ncbi:MAG: type I-B CRISPR-associated endonuclease Cas1b [Candidatus Pacearchaeota archaeon]